METKEQVDQYIHEKVMGEIWHKLKERHVLTTIKLIKEHAPKFEQESFTNEDWKNELEHTDPTWSYAKCTCGEQLRWNDWLEDHCKESNPDYHTPQGFFKIKSKMKKGTHPDGNLWLDFLTWYCTRIKPVLYKNGENVAKIMDSVIDFENCPTLVKEFMEGRDE